MSEQRLTGTITRLNQNGYGFISSKVMQFTRIYFHWTMLEPPLKFTDLKRGMEVEFTPYPYRDKGYRATKVKLYDKPQTEVRDGESVVAENSSSSDISQPTSKPE